jgi:hypothetical protein
VGTLPWYTAKGKKEGREAGSRIKGHIEKHCYNETKNNLPFFLGKTQFSKGPPMFVNSTFTLHSR